MPRAKKRWTFGLPMTRPAPVPKLQQFALAGYLTELDVPEDDERRRVGTAGGTRNAAGIGINTSGRPTRGRPESSGGPTHRSCGLTSRVPRRA
jgi:hypothetical protein